ncbi:hypothetical protein ACFV6E_33640 [Streptomyces sp. NPDC059785]|uniref:hypothetical protein n=1 Tax=unclassified Streptomyces TaxID=2593676 RepID=UPI0036625814
MTSTFPATGRRRRIYVPPPAESVTPGPAQQDPPIYQALLRSWADRGRTLPGRHDPEWVLLAAPPAALGELAALTALSVTQDPRGDGR